MIEQCQWTLRGCWEGRPRRPCRLWALTFSLCMRKAKQHDVLPKRGYRRTRSAEQAAQPPAWRRLNGGQADTQGHAHGARGRTGPGTSSTLTPIITAGCGANVICGGALAGAASAAWPAAAPAAPAGAAGPGAPCAGS